MDTSPGALSKPRATRLFLIPAYLLACFLGFSVNGQTLVNGGSHNGAINTNDTSDTWTFHADVGESIHLRMGTTNFTGQYHLFAPSGALIFSTGGGGDLSTAYEATNSGTFTVSVNSYFAGGMGSYVLHYAKIPGAYVASDDGSAMTNGGNHVGFIELADLDLWTFEAVAGDRVFLRMGSSNVAAQCLLYGPDGTLLATSGGGGDVSVGYAATTNGTFTVLVNSYFAGGVGSYVLHYAKIPGTFVVFDEGGQMTNGVKHVGFIKLADFDLWSFDAAQGDAIVLRLGVTNFHGQCLLYGPTGSYITSSGGGSDVGIRHVAATGGTFSVLVSSYFGGGTGFYRFNLAKIPGAFATAMGDQGGIMNGSTDYFGTIELADIDMWSFVAKSGELIDVGLETTNFTGYLELYNPDGTLVNSRNGGDISIATTASHGGTFTVLVSSYFSGGSGSYRLTANNLTGKAMFNPPTRLGTTDLILEGSEGPAGALFTLLTHTNVAAPKSLWTPVRTNYFDSAGAFQETISIDPSDHARFFMLVQP